MIILAAIVILSVGIPMFLGCRDAIREINFQRKMNDPFSSISDKDFRAKIERDRKYDKPVI